MIKTKISSLKYRIAITVFIMEAVMLTVVLWNTFRFIEIQAQEDFTNRHQIVLELIKQITSNSIFSEEYDDLQQYIEQISLDPEILNISIINLDNIIIADSDFQKVGQEPVSHIASENHYWETRRLPKMGLIEVGFSLTRIKTQLQKAKHMGIGLALTGMFIIAIGGLSFGFLLTHKLGSLTRIISKFKDSGKYVRIDVTGNDEIATLSHAFNHMSNKINDYISRIQSDKDLLEIRVAERTEELETATSKLIDANQQLKNLSITDHLTQVYNRIKVEDQLESEKQRFERYETIYSIILLDIDKFKQVNDTYGHNVGDKVLVSVASLLKKNIRNTEILGRWGGEEFIIICPESELKSASLLAEKLRKIIEHNSFDVIGHITCSFGVAQARKNEFTKELIKRSDIALYKAKEDGRNRVVEG